MFSIDISPDLSADYKPKGEIENSFITILEAPYVDLNMEFSEGT